MKAKMKKMCWLSAVGVGLGLMVAAYGQAPANPAADRYIVTLKSGESPVTVVRDHGLAPDFVYTKVLNGFAGFIPPGRLRALAGDPRVAAITPDNVVWAFGEVTPNGVARVGAAPGAVGYTGDGVGVAVVDTGLDFNHADLQPLGTKSYTAYGTSAQDDNGHGTHVGGIIAARDNDLDVVGVAPGATLYAVKVLDRSGTGYDSDIMGGLDWVVANAGNVSPPIRVVNMSLGRGKSDDDSAMRQAQTS